MTHRDDSPLQILQIYRERIRPFLQQHQVGGIESLDRQAELLKQAQQHPQQVRVGFFGEAQVGKSSLINAVAGRPVLPAGGIGPLTARATSVVHADEDQINVCYHDRHTLNQLAFDMARYLESIGELPKWHPSVAGAVQAAAGDALAPWDGEAGDASDQHEARTKGDDMLLKAKRMLGIERDLPKPSGLLLVEAMRSVVDASAAVTEPFPPLIESRIAELRALVDTQESLNASALGGAGPFNTALKERAAGWRSPMIADLQLALSAPSLQGLSLVDLPGIGTVADPGALAAKEFVEGEGHALVIVFRNSGLTQAIADLLEQTGVITRILFDGTDGHRPIRLLLVVTHLDDVAKNRWADLWQKEGEQSDRNVLFRDLAREMQDTLRAQVQGALLESEAIADLLGDQRQARQKAVNRLCSSMKVICVSSPEYLSLTGQTPINNWLTDVEATGIPALRAALQQMAQEATQSQALDVQRSAEDLHWMLQQHLAILHQNLSEGMGAATEEAKRFRAELEQHLVPLREQMLKQHGDALGLLRWGLPERIDVICCDALCQGQQRLQRLIKKHRKDQTPKTLWMALQRRGGVWQERSINYPGDLTLAMVDAIAALWEPRIIAAVRKEIADLVDFDVKLVEQLFQAATALNANIVAKSQIKTQKKMLKKSSGAALTWTGEQVDGLRRTVQEKLRKGVERPIEEACMEVRSLGELKGHEGKATILDAFEEGGRRALQEARKTAETVLREQYNALLSLLEKGYLKHHDPLTTTFGNLTDEMARRTQLKDRHERESILAEIDALILELDLLGQGPVQPDAEAEAALFL